MARSRSAFATAARAGRAVVLVVVAGLLIGACGSSSSPTASSESPASKLSPSPTEKLILKVDACSLVTADEASSAAGTTVANMSSAGGVQIPGACFYGSSDGKASVVIFAQTYPDASSAQAVSPEQVAAAINLGAAGGASAKAVSGIGDKAIEYAITSAGTEGTVIVVFKSNVVVIVSVSPGSSSSVEQLAKSAVGRL